LIGVDKTPEGKEKVTYALAAPFAKNDGENTETGGQSGKKKLGSQYTILIPSSAEGRMLLNSSIGRFIKYSHIVIEIWSEKAARSGVNGSMSFNIRSRDFRETVYFMVVKGSAEEYIKQNQPVLESNLYRYYEGILSKNNQSGYYLPATFHEFYNRLKNSGGSPYMTYSAINPMTGNDEPNGTKNSEQKGDPYLAGGVPRTGTADTAEVLGLAVFKQDKMVGVLNSDETRAVAILLNKFPRGYVGVVDPLSPEKDVINLNVYTDTKPKIIASLNDGKPSFNIAVQLELELFGLTANTNYEAPEYRTLLETQVSNLFTEQIMNMIKHTQELSTDPVGFGLYLRPDFANTNELDQTNLTELYKIADFNVNVSTKLRRTGLIWRTSPQQK